MMKTQFTACFEALLAFLNRIPADKVAHALYGSLLSSLLVSALLVFSTPCQCSHFSCDYSYRAAQGRLRQAERHQTHSGRMGCSSNQSRLSYPTSACLPMSLPSEHPQMVSLCDRRIAQIETGLDTLTDQMRDQSATLNRMSDALSAVVRLEERLTASIESSKEQRESLKHVHDRMDDHKETLNNLLGEVYDRIDKEATA